MHVLFVEPAFPRNQREFARALSAVGAQVTAIGEAPLEHLDDELKSWLSGYQQVPSVVNEGALLEAVRQIQQRGWVDRLEATVEAHILPVARVREACGIPGTSVQTAYLCRDKPSMKEALRQAGVPTAQSTAADSPDEVREFVSEVGFPVILKPRAAAGASGTYRADDEQELARAIIDSGSAAGHSVAVEEFVVGHEGFYDTISIGGEVALDFVSHYYPNVLEAMRSQSAPAYLVTTNRIDLTGYEELKVLGKKVIDALGIGTSATHMEWFFGPKGLKFSEIGCRPPGVSVWDLYGAANDLDLYREWANAIAHGRIGQAPSRRFSAGMINLRPQQDGQIVGYEGLEKVEQAVGEHILDYHFPPPGSPTAPVSGGYMVNAWMRLRHSDYDELRHIMEFVGQTIQVRAA